MADRTSNNSSPDLASLPMQPTGSGTADLEIAYERMKLAEPEVEDAPADADEVPSAGDLGSDEREAHPS